MLYGLAASNSFTNLVGKHHAKANSGVSRPILTQDVSQPHNVGTQRRPNLINRLGEFFLLDESACENHAPIMAKGSRKRYTPPRRNRVLPLYLLLLAQAGPTGASIEPRKLYEAQCALCHGQNGGGGRGPSLLRPTLPKAPDEKALARVISEGIPPEMPGAWQLSPDEATRLAIYVRGLGRIEPESVPGDPVRGEAVYKKNACNNCHIIAGQGSGLGPELTAIGLRRNAAHLRQSIVEPAKSLPEGFLLYKAETQAGLTVTGQRLHEDPFDLLLKDNAGRLHSFSKASLRSLTAQPNATPMPAYTRLNVSDLQDLVAYLASLKGTPAP